MLFQGFLTACSLALGIYDEVERLGLKGSKKKKGKKLDEDFVVCRAPVSTDYCVSRVFQPDLKPLILKDVPKVVQAMRQTQSRKVLFKILTRIKVRPLLFPSSVSVQTADALASSRRIRRPFVRSCVCEGSVL